MGARATGRWSLLAFLALTAACGTEEPVAVSVLGAGSARITSWAGERLFNSVADDWEPAVAVDPGSSYVYVLTTRYNGEPACSGHCPDPALILRVSSDGGASFGPESYLCVCQGTEGQNDPQIAVALDGTVYTAWINDFVPGVVFSRSRDHGRTWSPPKVLFSRLPFSDKPILAISADGRDIYLAANASSSYMVASHDFGATFSRPLRTNHDDRYYFANGGFVASNGIVTFSEASYTQTSTGPVFIHTLRSADGGRSWETTLVDVVPEQPDCTFGGCPLEFYGPADALAGDASGRLVLLYNGPLVPKGPQRMFLRRSTDGGATWGARLEVSAAPAGANAAFPAAVGTGIGDFRIWYMDDRNGPLSWNVWFRRSSDGGLTWSPEVRLSDALGGASYKTPAGFAQPYGDYGQIAVTSRGATIAVWGEGTGFAGPGGTWINREAPERVLSAGF